MNEPIWMALPFARKEVTSYFRSLLAPSKYAINLMASSHPRAYINIEVPNRLYHKNIYSIGVGTLIPYFCKISNCKRKKNIGAETIEPTVSFAEYENRSYYLNVLMQNGLIYENHGIACDKCSLKWTSSFPNIDYQPPSAINVRQLYYLLRMMCASCVFQAEGHRVGQHAGRYPNHRLNINNPCKVHPLWVWIVNHPQIRELLTDAELSLAQKQKGCSFMDGSPLGFKFANKGDGFTPYQHLGTVARTGKAISNGRVIDASYETNYKAVHPLLKGTYGYEYQRYGFIRSWYKGTHVTSVPLIRIKTEELWFDA